MRTVDPAVQRDGVIVCSFSLFVYLTFVHSTTAAAILLRGRDSFMSKLSAR